MGFKGFKKDKDKSNEATNHFEQIPSTNQIGGRPVVDDYKKQNKRIQFYISQEMIDNMASLALQNGCKDVTAYAKKLFVEEFEKAK